MLKTCNKIWFKLQIATESTLNFIPQALNAFQIPSQTVTENQQISRKSSLRQLAPSSTKMTNDFSNKSIKQFTHLRRPTDGIPQKISFVVSGPRFSSVSTSRRLTRQITPTQASAGSSERGIDSGTVHYTRLINFHSFNYHRLTARGLHFSRMTLRRFVETAVEKRDYLTLYFHALLRAPRNASKKSLVRTHSSEDLGAGNFRPFAQVIDWFLSGRFSEL